MPTLSIRIADEHAVQAIAGYLWVRPKFSTFIGTDIQWMAWSAADDIRKLIETGLGEIARDETTVPEDMITGTIAP